MWGFNITIKDGLNKNIASRNDNAENFNFINSSRFYFGSRPLSPFVVDIMLKNCFVDTQNISNLFVLDPDIQDPILRNNQKLDKNSLKINTLDNLILTNYYSESG